MLSWFCEDLSGFFILVLVAAEILQARELLALDRALAGPIAVHSLAAEQGLRGLLDRMLQPVVAAAGTAPRVP